MSTVIKLRRGTAAEWSSNGSTVLASGEPGFELDTGRFKIGNGTTAWSGLVYASIVPSGFIAGSGISINLGSNGSYVTISSSGGANIYNYGDNRVLTSDGTATGINAENNLTFDGTTLLVNGTGVSVSGHTHTSSSITDFNSSVSGLLPVVMGTGYIVSSFTNNIYTISATGLQPSGNYSVVGHTHTASNITDFNSSVSGLIQVKNMVGGSGINVSSLSGIYTIATSGDLGLTTEEVDDRVAQLLVEGTGVNLTYNDASGILTIDNLHSEINVLSQEPQGFVNRSDSIVSFNDSTRTFTIQPAVSGGEYDIYVKGIKVAKTGVETVVIGTGTNLNYLHFDINPPYSLQNKITEFNFDTDVPIAYIHWNGGISQSTFFGEERHGIRMDSSTHKWIHNTFGIQYIDGLSIGGYTLLGDGSSNSHAQINISEGTLYQEDIIIDVTNGSGSGVFVQELSPIAYIPTYYHSGSTGQWVRDSGTAFPLKYNGTRAQYNLDTAGTWTTPNVTNGRYFAMWIVATNDIKDPILAIVGQREDSSLTSAESNNTWSDINLNNIPTQEIRPLYRLIFTTNNSYTNTPKSSLQSVLDIRVAIQSTVAGVTQNDHGSLFGLADDDHNQYVHINNARTIEAVHTFSNGLNASGLISAASGNFSSLTVNGTGVSVSGHTHTASSITDFNEAVDDRIGSGLFVAGTGINLNYNDGSNSFTVSVTGLIANPTTNRILTSRDSTTTGIDAESDMTFNQGYLNIGGINNANPAIIDLYNSNSGDQATRLSFINSSGNYMLSVQSDDDIHSNYIYSDYYPLFIYSVGGPLTLNSQTTLDIIASSGTSVSNGNFSITNQTANTIAGFDGSKNVSSLSTGTYPSLTELSYVKGVTSSIQTQLNGKAASSHTHTTSDITNFNSSVSGLLPTIANSGDNRILTSTGSTVGINAESNLTFDGNLLNVTGSGSFVSGINVGGSSTTGVITGLSTTATIPAIRFQSITANHTNTSHVIFDWSKNISTRVLYIDGAGSTTIDATNGLLVVPSTSPSAGNGALVAHGMRRATTTAGMDFAWGESITSATEPGVDLFPIGGTHIASGILLRLSKNSTKTDVAMLVNGSGNVGIGTTTPTARLQVAGQGVFNSGIVTTTGNFTTSLTSALLNIDNLRLDSNTISSTNSNGDILLTPNGTGKVGIGTSSPSYTLDVNGGAQFNQVYPVVASGSIVSSAVDTDVTTGQIFNIELTENITLNNPTNSVDGVTIRWRIQQDSTGGRTVTLDTKFQIPSSASNPLPWSTGANVMDTLAATYHAGRDKWDIVAFVPGY